MHRQILLGLRIRHAALLDQPHSLKLELARKLPTLHDAPPVPLKHLTWCLRNRVQANIGHELETGRLTPGYLRFYHVMFQLMMFGMALALTANDIGLLWAAVELAT